MAFTDAADQGDDPNAGGGAPPAAPGGGGGGPPGNPMQGGGPILAALANKQRQPPVSAPGPGDQANSMQMVMQAIAMIQQALPGLPPGMPIHRDALRAVTQLSRHVPQGAPTAGVQKTHLQDLLQGLVRNALLQKVMGQAKPQPGGGPDQPAGGNPMAAMAQQPPMPSTPLPGS